MGSKKNAQKNGNLDEKIKFLESREFEKKIALIEKIYEEYENLNLVRKLDYIFEEIGKLNKKTIKLDSKFELDSDLRKKVDYLSKLVKNLPLERISELNEIYPRINILKNKIREINHNFFELNSKVEEKYPEKDKLKNARKDLMNELDLFEEDFLRRFKDFESEIKGKVSKIDQKVYDTLSDLKKDKILFEERLKSVESQLDRFETRLNSLSHVHNIFESEMRKQISKIKALPEAPLKENEHIKEKVNYLEKKQKLIENQLNLEEVKVLDEELHDLRQKINSLRDALLQNENYIFSLKNDLNSTRKNIEKGFSSFKKGQPTIIH